MAGSLNGQGQRILVLAVTLAFLLHPRSRGQEANVPDKPAQELSKADQDEPALHGQPRSIYRQRRMELMRRLQEQLGRGQPPGSPATRPLVVLRGPDDPDIQARFRQSNNLAYLTGASVPSATLVLGPEPDSEKLYIPPPDPQAGLFIERQTAPGPEAAKTFELRQVLSSSRLLSDLFGLIDDPMLPGRAASKVVVFLPGADDGNTENLAQAGPEGRLAEVLRLGAPTTRFRDLGPALAAMRKVKSESEIAQISRAIAITGASLNEVASNLKPGQTEYQIHGTIVGAFLREGAQREGFPSIVASGNNASIPHYFGTGRAMEAGDLLVLDIGAEYEFYTADISRTFPVNGKFTTRQKELYQLVLETQKEVESAIKPGKTRLYELTRVAREFLDKSPLRARDGKNEEQRLGRFLVHGIGHYLGMDVHDVGSYSEPLNEGEVFTIEPGLYIPSENLGIRIEDDYLMTESGAVKLSAEIPSDPEAVEAWMTGKP